MICDRRAMLRTAGSALCASLVSTPVRAAQTVAKPSPLKITGLKVTPIALPDPPILAASGCHGPYFLRTIIQIETDAGIVGVGETVGGKRTHAALEKAREQILGKNVFAYRILPRELYAASPGAYAGVELACLDACGKATGRRLCELLGGPVRDEVEFAAYLFFRYAADHPKLLADPRIVDDRKNKPLDDWGEIRSAARMVEEAARFQKQWGFKVFKLKGGVLPPEVELEAMQAMNGRFSGQRLLRIDPNGRWTTATAVRIGKKLRDVKLEYYEDPVRGQEAMAEVRQATELPMSTNMCVTRFPHIPPALRIKPIDVVLCDLHYWGGIPACQELGRISETVGWKVSQHSNNHAGITMAAMIHVGAVVPQLTVASDTHYPWLPAGADIIQGGKLPIRDGRMPVPDGAGVGVQIDQDQLARAAQVYEKCGMRERDDAFTMRLIQPDWRREKEF